MQLLVLFILRVQPCHRDYGICQDQGVDFLVCFCFSRESQFNDSPNCSSSRRQCLITKGADFSIFPHNFLTANFFVNYRLLCGRVQEGVYKNDKIVSYPFLFRMLSPMQCRKKISLSHWNECQISVGLSVSFSQIWKIIENIEIINAYRNIFKREGND